MLLPNGDRAIIDPAKLRDYCLSPAHPRGKHKARLFAAALGFTQTDWPILHAALAKAAQGNEATLTRSDEYGRVYEMTFLTTGKTRTVTILAVWIVEPPDDLPRLVSCYPV